MLADGAWKRLNATNYITCDDYDGKNSPKRIGLNLKSYFNKVNLQYCLCIYLLVNFLILLNFRKVQRLRPMVQ